MKMIFNGQECDASDGRTIEVVNPATGKVLDTVPAATREDVDRVVQMAVEGQKRWAEEYPLHKRVDLFYRFLEMLKPHREEISLMLCRETGRPIEEAYMDFDNVFTQIKAFAAAAQSILGGKTQPLGSSAGCENDIEMTIREPLGVIVTIPAFNGPLNQWAKKAGPALLAGNSVIHKPPTVCPLSTGMLVKVAHEAGIPGYALHLITGNGGETGEYLSSDSRIAGISVTGSTRAGLSIARNLAGGLKFMQLELGGNAPQIVCADADIDLAAKEAIQGRAVPRSGQVCAASKRFIVHSSVKDEFRDKLVAGLKGFTTGDPENHNTKIGTLVSLKAAQDVEAQVNLTIEQGAELVLGNKRDGAFYLPTVLDNCTSDMDIAHDMEIFGPVFPIFEFDDLNDAIALANDTNMGLGSSIFTKDYPTAMKAATRIEAGTVVINGHAAYVTMRSPFGGYKLSGFGVESQYDTLTSMTSVKHIVMRRVLD